MPEPMTAAEFKSVAEEVFAALPDRFHAAISNVVIFIEEFPDADTLAGMNMESPYDLLGLYQGWPLPERGSQYAGHLPDVIRLYRQPILAYSRTRGEEIRHCIRHVLIHEIGHYFGFSDDEMRLISNRP
jgi:predicted Zn-dependent protease with MMP-like domain